MRSRRHRRTGAAFLIAVVLVALSACSKPFATVERGPVVASSAINESSGLAPSHRASDLLWTINDSGGQPVLYAIGSDGALRGTVRIAGVKNVDWEDLASFELEGRSWLLVADVGDNDGRRKDCALHVIAEPDPVALSPAQELTVAVAWTIPVRFPDAPHDCESVAVDAHEGTVYLLRKRENPPRLFLVPLRPVAGAPVPVAREVSKVAHLPQPDSKQRALPIPTGRYRGQPTGMDFASDGRTAVVLTYGDVAFFKRHGDESWAVTLARTPLLLPPHGLGQAEGICFSADGLSVFVTEEKAGTNLLRYTLSPELLK